MRCLLVGFSRVMQTDHLPVYLEEGMEISAVVDFSPSRLHLAQQILPHCRVYESLDDALAAERVDFCDIAVPPYCHSAMIRKCIKSHVPVLCEKPLVVHAPELQELLNDLQCSKTILFPCHTWLYAPQFIEVVKIIESEIIGDSISLDVDLRRTAPAQGASEWRPNWRTELPISGGGIMMDHGYHVLYMAQHLLQAQPSSVQVLHSRCTPNNALDLEIRLQCEFISQTADQRSKTVWIHLTWLAPERSTSYQIIGETGTLCVRDSQTYLSNSEQKSWVAPDGGLTASSQHPEWFRRLFASFKKCCKERKVFHDELRVACFTMESLWTSYSSLMHGERQVVDPSLWISFFNS